MKIYLDPRQNMILAYDTGVVEYYSLWWGGWIRSPCTLEHLEYNDEYYELIWSSK